jgi:hypothetical protein
MSDLQTLRSKLRSELKIDPNGRIWNDTVLNRAINDSIGQVESEGNYDWHFNNAENSESTVIGQSGYDLPDNFVRLEADTVLYDSASLRPIDYNFGWKNKYFTTSGTPSSYSVWGDKIYLAKMPDSIKSLQYLFKKKQTAMVADSNDSGLPSEFDLSVIKWAAYLCWSTIEGKENKSISAAQDFQEAMKGLFAQYLGRREQNNYSFGIEVC